MLFLYWTKILKTGALDEAVFFLTFLIFLISALSLASNNLLTCRLVDSVKCVVILSIYVIVYLNNEQILNMSISTKSFISYSI